MNRARRFLRVALPLYAAVFVTAAALGGLAYFHYGDPQHACASCHEMTGVHSDWNASAHRTLHCRNCHGGSLTLDAHALRAHVRRVVEHFTGDPEQPIRLGESDVLALHRSCQACHPQSFADWEAGGHAATYARVFLDREHNRTEPPAEDCLRCHGMFFDRPVGELVARTGPSATWALRDPAQAAKPAIPCLACHQVHTPSEGGAVVHLYDPRSRLHLSPASLPAPRLEQDGRIVPVSSDARQRLCAQCHAPAADHRLGSSDDRTPAGVHAGLSCLDCHGHHRLTARSSCAACHPARSNCGRDVRTMDTTFLDATSRHDIHTVACRDCHPEGTPRGRRLPPGPAP